MRQVATRSELYADMITQQVETAGIEDISGLIDNLRGLAFDEYIKSEKQFRVVPI